MLDDGIEETVLAVVGTVFVLEPVDVRLLVANDDTEVELLDCTDEEGPEGEESDVEAVVLGLLLAGMLEIKFDSELLRAVAVVKYPVYGTEAVDEATVDRVASVEVDGLGTGEGTELSGGLWEGVRVDAVLKSGLTGMTISVELKVIVARLVGNTDDGFEELVLLIED